MSDHVREVRILCTCITIVLLGVLSTMASCKFNDTEVTRLRTNESTKHAEQLASMVKAGADPVRAACAVGVLNGSMSRDVLNTVGCQGK